MTPARALGYAAAVVAAGLALPLQPSSSLSVFTEGQWRVWWHADRAPTRWTKALPLLRDAVRWNRAGPGLEWGTLLISGPGESRRTRVVLVRVDPSRFEFRLAVAVDYQGTGNRWTIDSAPPDAALAFNAGQFAGVMPWGWLVHQGRERRRPGTGPLSMAVLFDSSGAVHLLGPAELDSARAARLPMEAFQSYPTLLAADGYVPPEISAPFPGIKWGHRDSRLALGRLRDGRLLLALTRFDALGGTLAPFPLGLTVREMAAVAGALGCREAVMLDGGLSGQLLVRDSAGEAHRFVGWRKVPMGLVVLPRARNRIQ